MLQVEIKVFNKRKSRLDFDNKYIVVNGIEDKEAKFFLDDRTPLLNNKEVINELTKYSFKEVGDFLDDFSFYKSENWWESEATFEICCTPYANRSKKRAISIRIQFQDWEYWTNSWSMYEETEEFRRQTYNLNRSNIRYWQEDEDSILNGFGIIVDVKDENSNINSIVIESEEAIKEILQKTKQNLLLKTDEDKLVVSFNFPEEIKTACSQYLIYFAQFLLDHGIGATTELKEELNNTLFKVSPINKEESLEKIRDALNIYLTTAVSNDIEIFNLNTDISVQQWQANIFHLKSQLALATSIIQAKDSTIQSLHLTNYQLIETLSTNKIKNSDNKEEIIKGVVSVDKLDIKGVSINLAELVRKMKRSLK